VRGQRNVARVAPVDLAGVQGHAVAADRPGYGSSRLLAGGLAANARAVLDDLDTHGITRVVLVGTPTAAGWHWRQPWRPAGSRR
jgi:hypothetical protein